MIPEGRSPQGILGLVTLTSSNPHPAAQTSRTPHTKSRLSERTRGSGREVTEYHPDDRTVPTHHAAALATCLVVTLNRFQTLIKAISITSAASAFSS